MVGLTNNQNTQDNDTSAAALMPILQRLDKLEKENVILILTNRHDRFEILNDAKALANSAQFKGVCINLDRTMNERVIFSKIKTERDSFNANNTD